MAKLFIGIPTWNRTVFVKEAIESVLSQGISDIRLLVSDNCSEPKVSDVVKTYIDQLEDPRVTFVRQPKNRGQNGQLEYFLDQCADEEFFALLDDDDRYDKGFLETAITTLNDHPEIAFFSSSQYVFDEDGQILEERTEEYNASLWRNRLEQGEVRHPLELVLGGGVFSLSATVFRTETLRECGLLDSLDAYPPDFNIFLRQAERGKTAYWCEEKLAGYRWHAGQSRKYLVWVYNESLICRFQPLLEARCFHGGPEKRRRWLLSFVYLRQAYINLVKGEFGAAYGLLVRSLRTDPLRWQSWIYSVFAALFPFLVKRLWKSKVTLIEAIPN